MDFKPIYRVYAQEEFAKLEKRVAMFTDCYSIKGAGPITISLDGISREIVFIVPEKFGCIDAVISNEAQPKGILQGATEDYLVMKLEDITYQIYYKPSK
jgi:hypothetical protein